MSLRVRIPEPYVADEFSYLLAADTFVHGRLSNPTHPLWVHFESFHIIQQPTYASKYPPAQGMILAAGQIIGGHPIVGVWISVGLACAAIYWMLLAWLPPRWALLGGLLAVTRTGIFSYWSQSYWGGAVAAAAGALVFGAVRRIMHGPRVRDALLMGMGLAVLANSRPYEGLVVSLPVAVVLLAWMVGRNGPTIGVSIRRIALPLLVVFLLTGGAMGFYNLRVTGDAFRLPYQVYEATYSVTPLFLWQRPRPEPMYHHYVMRQLDTGWALVKYSKQRSVRGLARAAVGRVQQLRGFYLGQVLTFPLVMLPWILRDRWMRFALLTGSMLLIALNLETYFVQAHYAAPATGLVFVLVLQGMRHLRLLRWRGRSVGQVMLVAVLGMYTASVVMKFIEQPWIDPNLSAWSLQRARILAQFKRDEERHLIIVRYGSQHSLHNEWVYNEADIDNAKVVWAREMDRAQNYKLIEYFADRRAWLLEVDQDNVPPILTPYPIGSAHGSS